MSKYQPKNTKSESVPATTSSKSGKSKFNRNKRYKRSSNDRDEREARVKATENVNVDAVHTNDISWWNKAIPLFADATRVPFNRIVGDPIVTPLRPVTNVTSTADYEAVPGIMRFDYIPSVGYANNSNDPVNRAFTSIYGDIYSRTTGAMQFTQSDLALFVLGVSSIAQMIGVMKRALGVCQLYASKNYYYPKHLLLASGFEPTSIINNQDDLRRRLNQCIQSLNAMKVPNFIDLFKRHYTLASNVWLDEDSPEAQMFVFVPSRYYAYDDQNSKLKATDTGLTNSTGANWLLKIEAALNLWRNSSDLGLISGSIQRAYKDSSLLSLEMVTLDSVIIPTFDKVMLSQINNCTILPGIPANLDVAQDVVNNVTKFEPYYLKSVIGEINCAAFGSDSVLINSFEGDFSPEAVMEMTRLTNLPEYNGTDKLNLTYCGTEIIHGCLVYFASRETAISTPALDILSVGSTYQSAHVLQPSPLIDMVQRAGKVSTFRNGPRFEFMTHAETQGGGYDITSRNRIGDLYKYTTLDRNAYQGLQAAALQSIYVVSEVTKPNNFQK